MINSLLKLLKDENGASLAEYGFLVALIAVVAITMMTSLGSNISAKFQAIRDAISNAGNV